MLCYGFGDCCCQNCEEKHNDPSAHELARLVVGEQCLMCINEAKIRVLCLSLPELDDVRKERRGHVVVLEDNPYVKAGAECRPLAYTLHTLPK